MSWRGRGLPVPPGAGMEQLPCPAIHGAAVSCLLLKSTPWPKGFQCDLALQGAIPNLRSNSCPGWRRRLPSRAVWAVGKEVSGSAITPWSHGKVRRMLKAKPCWQRGHLCCPRGLSHRDHRALRGDTETRSSSARSNHRSQDAGETGG